ncbi:hypothetical protein MRX96_023742 [Rhipicephalus microplus]
MLYAFTNSGEDERHSVKAAYGRAPAQVMGVHCRKKIQKYATHYKNEKDQGKDNEEQLGACQPHSIVSTLSVSAPLSSLHASLWAGDDSDTDGWVRRTRVVYAGVA